MKLKYLVLFVILFFKLTNASTQNAYVYGGGAGQISLGTITEQLSGTDAIYFNNAAVCNTKHSYGLDMSFENKFGISSLNTFSIGLFKKIQNNFFVLSAVQNGNEILNERDFTLGVSRQLFDKFYLGTKFHFYNLSIDEYGKSSSFGVDISLYSHINRALSLSTTINNIGSTKINQRFERPVRMALGLGYHPSDKINFIMEVEKIEDRPISPKIGIVYDFNKSIQLRTGADIGRSIFGFGFIYAMNKFSINLGLHMHNELGSTPGISLQWDN